MSTIELDDLKNTARLTDLLAWALWNVPDEDLLGAFHAFISVIFNPDEESVRLISEASGVISEEGLLEIAVDYTSLFASYQLDSPHPYESVYRDEEGLLMGDTRDAVLECYRAAGYQVKSGEVNEPEDHISHELWFISYLLNKAADAREQSNTALVSKTIENATSFCNDHLSKWVPQFSDDINRQAKTGFYQGIALLLNRVPSMMSNKGV